MLKSLRGQLIISHILPALIILPIMGVVLVFFLEKQFILPSLEKLLRDDAIMIVRILRSQPQIFMNSQLANSTLQDFELETSIRVMILDVDGKLIASSDPGDVDQIREIMEINSVSAAKAGSMISHVDFNQRMRGDILDVFAPVTATNGEILGILRLSYRFTTITEQLLDLRFLILVIVVFAAVASAGVGFLLALNIDRPIQNVTQSIFDLATGARGGKLTEAGPEEIKLLQGTANFLVDRLQELEEGRRQLLSNLVHELGRPLGGLRAGIQVLRAGAKEDTEVLDDLLEGMETETNILRRLLEDLSHLHDQLVGSVELNFETIALSEWLPIVLNSAQRRAKMKGLLWREDIPIGLPCLDLDPQRMAQAIGNLTANAIKYTPKNGTVAIAVGEQADQVWIRISDDGPGIPIGEHEKIFDAFYRGKGEKRIVQGMGLGLSIARDVVLAHQGRIELKSAPGSGSQFTVWLPKKICFDDLLQKGV